MSTALLHNTTVTRAGKIPGLIVNFAVGQVKMEVCWSGGQVKLTSVGLSVDK